MAATKERKRHWLKAFVSIAVTLVAMPMTHILAGALKEGTAADSYKHLRSHRTPELLVGGLLSAL